MQLYGGVDGRWRETIAKYSIIILADNRPYFSVRTKRPRVPRQTIKMFSLRRTSVAVHILEAGSGITRSLQ